MTDKNRKLKDINLLPSQTRWKKPQSGLYAGLEEEPDNLQELIQTAINEGDLSIDSVDLEKQQSDWTETDSTKQSYIKNKPTLLTSTNLGNSDQTLTGDRTVYGVNKSLSFNDILNYQVESREINLYANPLSLVAPASGFTMTSDTIGIGTGGGTQISLSGGISSSTELTIIASIIKLQTLNNVNDATKKFIKKKNLLGEIEFDSITTRELSDVDNVTPSSGDVLKWNSSVNKYVPSPDLNSGSSSINLANTDLTLTNNRILNGNTGSFSLTLNNLSKFEVSNTTTTNLFGQNVNIKPYSLYIKPTDTVSNSPGQVLTLQDTNDYQVKWRDPINLANTNLTLTNDRTVSGNYKNLAFNNINTFSITASATNIDSTVLILDSTFIYINPYDNVNTNPQVGQVLTITELNPNAGNLVQWRDLPGPINYSYTEQNTGIKWVDNKSIWQITVSITAGANISVSINGTISEVISIEGTQIQGTDTYLPLQGTGTVGNLYSFNKNTKILTGASNGKITIKYTKS